MYEGGGEQTIDFGAASNDGRKYYTVFSYDELGNISSGGSSKSNEEDEDEKRKRKKKSKGKSF